MRFRKLVTATLAVAALALPASAHAGSTIYLNDLGLLNGSYANSQNGYTYKETDGVNRSDGRFGLTFFFSGGYDRQFFNETGTSTYNYNPVPPEPTYIVQCLNDSGGYRNPVRCWFTF